MSAADATTPGPPESELHEIRLKGHLDDRWADSLEGLRITRERDGSTTLCGALADQAALHGVLNRIRDLGLPIISVRRVLPDIPGSKTMKAMVYQKYGSPDVLELREIDKPVIGDDEVLVRIRAASVNPGDWHFLTGMPVLVRPVAGLFRPKLKIPGHDMAGQVVAVGRNVTQFQPGDDVFGESSKSYAEYSSVSEGGIALKPANVTFEQAAAVPVAAVTALQGLRDRGQLQPGQRVLINGASGGVGTFAVQIARSLGAEVTAVCSTRNVELVRSIGADHVVDYTHEDFTVGDSRYDLMLDLVGNRSLSACRRVLNPTGAYVATVVRPSLLFHSLRASLFGDQRVRFLMAKTTSEDLVALKELIEAAEVTPAIDRLYPLNEAAEALRHQGEGHAQGKTVITVSRGG